MEFETLKPPAGPLRMTMVGVAYLLAGWNVLAGAARTLRRGRWFDENVLMVIATGGAMAIGAYSEAVGVMIFYKVGELLQRRAVFNSRRSIRALLATRPESANLMTADGVRPVAPDTVQVGETILVRPGEKVPLDGEVLRGESRLNAAALTGESVPLAARPGLRVRAGEINLQGALQVRVARLFAESSIARILTMVENAAARKARTEQFITTFARYYTPAVVAAAAALAFLPPLLLPGANLRDWVYRALVLLVISCPCALVVSIPLGYFGGVGYASRRGILVKGSNFIDALAAVKTVIFDKTGTLTQGVFEVRRVVSCNGFSTDALLQLAAAAEFYSTHPIAASIRDAMRHRGLAVDHARLGAHDAVPGCGVRARYDGRAVLVGNDTMMQREGVALDTGAASGTVVHVAVDGRYAGYLLIGDELHPDAQAAVHDLRARGVAHIVMFTGDNPAVAQGVADRLGLDAVAANLLPEDKVAALETLEARMGGGGKIAFVGDGINDAPVIARADVGIAMGGAGADAAVETADVVLMDASPAKLAEALRIAARTRTIVWQNIALALGIKGLFIGFGALGLASMWEAVFADMGTAVLAVLNATRTLTGPLKPSKLIGEGLSSAAQRPPAPAGGGTDRAARAVHVNPEASPRGDRSA
jgi:Cd2+/Zn2+-exporting ATPase